MSQLTAASGNLVKIQTRSCSDLLSQNLPHKMIPRWYLCPLKFKKHHFSLQRSHWGSHVPRMCHVVCCLCSWQWLALIQDTLSYPIPFVVVRGTVCGHKTEQLCRVRVGLISNYSEQTATGFSSINLLSNLKFCFSNSTRNFGEPSSTRFLTRISSQKN